MNKLTLTPNAFAKIVFMMDQSHNECGSFGIAPNPKKPLYITDFKFVKQEVTTVSLRFDKNSISDFTDAMDEKGLQPSQYMRIWQHCHPSDSPHPSGVDEKTFLEVCGEMDFSVMLIIARNRSLYCRLKIVAGPKIFHEQEIPVEIDWAAPFDQAKHDEWKKEFKDNVFEAKRDAVWSDYCVETKPTTISVSKSESKGGRKAKKYRAVKEKYEHMSVDDIVASRDFEVYSQSDEDYPYLIAFHNNALDDIVYDVERDEFCSVRDFITVDETEFKQAAEEVRWRYYLDKVDGEQIWKNDIDDYDDAFINDMCSDSLLGE